MRNVSGRRYFQMTKALATRWPSWLKHSGEMVTRRLRATPSTKQRPAGLDDRFLQGLAKVASSKGFDAAEQMIEARVTALWDRMSQLAEITDPARALDYAERRSASASRWTSRHPDATGGASGDESLDTTSMDAWILDSNSDQPSSDGPATSEVDQDDPLLQAIEAKVAADGLDAAEPLIMASQARAWLTLSKLAQPVDPIRALDYTQRTYTFDPTPPIERRLHQLLFRRGDIVVPERLFRSSLEATGGAKTRYEVERLAMLQSWKTLLVNGFPMPERRSTPAIEPIPDTSLYFLHNSLPQASAGYATRSHGLIRALQTAGISVLPYTRYGFPWDLKENRRSHPRPDFPLEEVVGDVTYRRLRTLAAGRGQIPVDRYMQACADELEAVARVERPSVIHAASNFSTGLAAVSAARQLGLPVIYEVRGLWEVTYVSRDPAWGESELFQTYVRLETQAATEADCVITITSALKEELIRRGVPADRITIVPNSVDAGAFTPEPRDRELEQQFGLEGKRVVGYIGTFTHYEGLDDLLYAVSYLIDQGVDDLHLLLVGDGAAFPELQELVRELELQENVTLTGRVPFSDVHRYYSLIDIAPFPRKPLPVTEMVSPLKPFEAMAMEKAVLVSSVAALAEIVDDGTTGLIFEKGNLDSLAAALRRLATDPQLCTQLGKNARQWVISNRSWERAGATVAGIHRELARESREAC